MFKFLDLKQQIDKANKIYKKSLDSEFYTEKYKGIVNKGAMEEWHSLPILEREELFENTYPKSASMITENIENMIVTSTGGSSGIARYTAYSHDEWDKFCDMQAKALSLIGIKKDDRVANLFIAGHLWPSFLGVHEALKRVGAVHLPISANIPQEDIVKLCHEFQANVMLSLPTLFVFMADIALKEGYDFKDLRLIGFAGEQMSIPAQEHVKKALKVKEIKALAYSSSDAGLMGYQCPHCGFGTYHVPSDFQLLEIVDEKTGKPVGTGETGEIIVTSLERKKMPLIRYRIGDLAYYTGEQCKCGDKNPVFRLMGRSGDDFKLGGAYISMNVLEDAIYDAGEPFSTNFRITIEDVGNKMDINITVETADKERAMSKVEKLKESVCKKIPEIPVGIKLNYISKFEVTIAEPGTIPRNPRTGKIKKLEDKRVKS